jgi:Zn-dependent protease
MSEHATDWPPRPVPDPVPDPEPQQQGPFGPDRPTLRKRLGGALAAIVAVLAKFKAVLLLLPKIKLLVTGGSMLVSLGAYAAIWGWQFGAGVVFLLFVHELGHYIQLKLEGIQPKALVFVPFLGAYVSSEGSGRSPETHARVALAGPILGSLAAVPLVLLWHATGNDLWRALAFFGFFINLFNLIPFGPLDGGQATEGLPLAAWVAALAVTIGVAAIVPSTVAILLVAATAYKLYASHRDAGEGKVPRFGTMSRRHQVMVAAAYIGLMAVLAVATNATHLVRHFGDPRTF